MKKRYKILLAILAVLALAAGSLAVAIHTGPTRALRRAEQFVEEHADTLEPLLDADAPLPVLPGVVTCSSWDAEHPMDEFLFGFQLGVPYSGCYYSPDDVPLSFQNASPDLKQDGENRWSWQGRGDNHGATVKLRDKWYYFEAWF